MEEDCVHLLLVEDETTKDDRVRYRCTEDPNWFQRPGYVLNKILHYLSDRLQVSSILVTDIPTRVPDDIDAIFVHVDVSLLPEHLVMWLAELSPEYPVINGAVKDLTKRAVDENRPMQDASLMLPEDATSGWAFVKSDFNFGQAPEVIYERVRVEDLNPDKSDRADLVVQRWIEDFRARREGFYTLERFTYLLGDITVRETTSEDPVVKVSNDCFLSLFRPRTNLRQDVHALMRAGFRPGLLPLSWVDNDAYWDARRSIITHYAGILGFDYAGIDAIQTEPGKLVVLDINPTPFSSRSFPFALMVIVAARFLEAIQHLVGRAVTTQPASVACHTDLWRQRWQSRMSQEVSSIVPRECCVLLVDDNTHCGELFVGRRFLRFCREEGVFGRAPSSDAEAIAELEKLRCAGADFLIVTWPAFWWLKYYPQLHSHVRRSFKCILDNRRVVIFDMRFGSC